MPTANGSVAKSLLALTAIAAMTGEMIYQSFAMREAQGAAARAVASPPPAATASLAASVDHGDMGPGMAEPLLLSASPGPRRGPTARVPDSRGDRR